MGRLSQSLTLGGKCCTRGSSQALDDPWPGLMVGWVGECPFLKVRPCGFTLIRGEEPEWLYRMDESGLQVLEARVYAELHRPLRAVPLLEQGLERCDSTHGREVGRS